MHFLWHSLMLVTSVVNKIFVSSDIANNSVLKWQGFILFLAHPTKSLMWTFANTLCLSPIVRNCHCWHFTFPASPLKLLSQLEPTFAEMMECEAKAPDISQMKSTILHFLRFVKQWKMSIVRWRVSEFYDINRPQISVEQKTFPIVNFFHIV